MYIVQHIMHFLRKKVSNPVNRLARTLQRIETTFWTSSKVHRNQPLRQPKQRVFSEWSEKIGDNPNGRKSETTNLRGAGDAASVALAAAVEDSWLGFST